MEQPSLVSKGKHLLGYKLLIYISYEFQAGHRRVSTTSKCVHPYVIMNHPDHGTHDSHDVGTGGKEDGHVFTASDERRQAYLAPKYVTINPQLHLAMEK